MFLLLIVLLLFCGCSTNNEQQSIDSYNIKIVSVAEWEGLPVEQKYESHAISSLTIHHGGEDFNKDRDIKEYLQNLQSWSRSEKNWIDIPYHYIIDLDGIVYAARDYIYPGDTNTDYNPEGHLLTCLVGNYENIYPNEKQLESLVNLLTWQCQFFKINPKKIKGHKDFASTLCPGKNLYNYISNGFLHKEVTLRLGKVILQN